MPKKVFELAKDLDLNPLDLVEKLQYLGFNVRNHMATLSDEELTKFMEMMSSDLLKKEDEKEAQIKTPITRVHEESTADVESAVSEEAFAVKKKAVIRREHIIGEAGAETKREVNIPEEPQIQTPKTSIEKSETKEGISQNKEPKHFYVVFNPYLDNGNSEYTQAHEFYETLRTDKKKNLNAFRYWGKIKSSKNLPLHIPDFKGILDENRKNNNSTYLFICDYHNLWVGKVEDISSEAPDMNLCDKIYKNKKVEIWFKIWDLTLLENNQKSTNARGEFLSIYSHKNLNEITAPKLNPYLSDLRFPLIVQDQKREDLFPEDKLQVLEDNPLLSSSSSQRIIKNLTSFCIPEKVFNFLPKAVREVIIASEIDVMDNRENALKNHTLGYMNIPERVVNDILFQIIKNSGKERSVWTDSKGGLSLEKKEGYWPYTHRKTIYLKEVYTFFKKGANPILGKKDSNFEDIFGKYSDLINYYLKDFYPLLEELNWLKNRNAMAHLEEVSWSKEEFYKKRSLLLGIACEGIINGLYHRFDNKLYPYNLYHLKRKRIS